jgi:hypothetical protein
LRGVLFEGGVIRLVGGQKSLLMGII